MRKLGKVFLAGFMCLSTVATPSFKIWAQDDNKITNITAKGRSSSGHEADLAIDGDISTYYLTPAAKSMQDHYRYIDLELDGLYEVSSIKIFNNTDSYNNYQIYASQDGKKFDKVAYKNTDEIATTSGDAYALDDVQASIIRVNLSYNSAKLEGNLAEVELYGERIGDSSINKEKNVVKDFKDTKWATEYEKFENNADYANQKTLDEVSALVGRVIGEEWVDQFVFELKSTGINGKDAFEIENASDGKIVIRGNNGVTLASGFNHYLKNYCNVDYDPLFVSNLNMPETLPQLENKIVKETQYDYRYALNYCTYSYTMAFWGWDEYQQFLDWAAMSGINTMLDIVGQEEVIYRTLSEFGYSDQEIKEYICGPGYFAWFYMQNMTSYGGELPDNWFTERVELGRKMHDRMQAFGIAPVLSGFSGQIPRNFKEKHPDVEFVAQGNWAGSGYQRPDMLRTYLKGDGVNYFDQMADAFYKAQQDVYGHVTNMYSVDPFHEGGNMGDMNATKVYEIIQNKMMQHDEDAIWLIQEWSGSIANNTQKLANLDKNHVIVLDLFSEVSPRNSALENADTPWIWNMLHNFGGRMGLDGNPSKLSQDIPETYEKSEHMVGIGMTPEAIENSPMVYELLFDMTWTSDSIDYRKWTEDYAKRRYGGTNDEIKEAWELLLNTGYNEKSGYYQGAPESVFNTRPRTDFNSASSWGHSTINYDKQELERAALLLANNYEQFKDSGAFIYDLSDVTRQVISNSALDCYKAMMSAYNTKNLNQFKILSEKFLEMMLLQDRVLATNPDFLVGTWIANSRKMLNGADDWTNDLFEYNARSLITTWGSKGESDGGLRDYSNRQWAGLTKDYYYPRWKMFIEDTIAAMENGKSLPTLGSYNWFLVESAWSTKKTDEGSVYSTNVSNENLAALTNEVLDNYSIANIKKLSGTVAEKENMALNKNVTVSIESDQDYPASNLTDGNKGTGWKASQYAKTFAITVDLEEETSIDGIELSMEQVPKQYPYTYIVEVYRDGKWTQVAEGTNGNVASNESIEYKGIGSQVRIKMTSLDETVIPEVYEIQVYGTQDIISPYKNVALGQTVTGPNNGQKPLSNIVDGNPSTAWISSNGNFPAPLTLTLNEEEYVEYMEVYFEKAGPIFQFDVTVEDAEGNKYTVLDMSENQEEIQWGYKINVNQKVKKVVVNIKSRTNAGPVALAWAALGEIMLMQPTDSTFTSQNIAFGKPGKVINTTTRTTTKLTDGDFSNLENVGSSIFPTAFEVDLGRDESLENVHIYFEKAGLRFQYKVEVIESDGTIHLLDDKTDNLDDLQADYEIPASVRGQKVIVTIVGRAPGGQFYLASPAMLEIEAYAKPGNIASNSEVTTNFEYSKDEMKALLDGNVETIFDLAAKKDGEAKEFVFDFGEKQDVYGYELYNGYEKAIQYKVEAYNDDSKKWIMIDDKINNLQFVKNYIGEFSPVLTNKVRLTVYGDDAKIADFNLYQYDSSTDLVAYITTLNNKISSVEIGDYAGNYTAMAKAKLDEVILAASNKTERVMNSKEVADEIAVLKHAYQVFLKSYVTISRDSLLTELSEVKDMLTNDIYKDNQELKAAYDLAKSVYNTYKVTQIELDACKDALMLAKEAAKSLSSSQKAYLEKIAEANKLIENTEVGEYNNNVSQEIMDSLINAVNIAQNDYINANTVSAVDAIIDNLTKAIEVFESNKIIVDKTALQEVIDKADNLNKNDYTKESWQAVIDALKTANEVNEGESSLSAVENAKNSLLEAIDNLVEIDSDVESNKIALKIAIDTAKTLKEQGILDNVVPAVVTEFETVLSEAEAILTDSSADQTIVDKAFYRLANAIHMLEFIRGDKSSLEALIKDAQRYEENNYTAETWNIFKNALNVAKDVVLNENALENEVVEALNNLTNGIAQLMLKVDKTRLQSLYDQVNELDKSLYTSSTVANLTEAMVKAVEVLTDENAVQTDIDVAYETLIRAYIDLRLIPNKDLLQGMINKVQTLNAANYTVETWDIVTSALQEAIAVINNPEASQEDVDKARDGLVKGIAGLQVVNTVETSVKESLKTGDSTSLLYPLAGLMVTSIVLCGSKKKQKAK